MNQKGFATLEVILMVVVLGILASIAVPSFNRLTAQANTAKVLSDLSAINAAAAVYQLEHNDAPSDYNSLKDYLEKGLPEKPSGKIFVNGAIADIKSSDTYDYSDGEATFGDYKAEDFTKKASTTTGN